MKDEKTSKKECPFLKEFKKYVDKKHQKEEGEKHIDESLNDYFADKYGNTADLTHIRYYNGNEAITITRDGEPISPSGYYVAVTNNEGDKIPGKISARKELENYDAPLKQGAKISFGKDDNVR